MGTLIGRFVVRFRALTIIVSLASLVLVSLGLARVELSTGYRAFFPADDAGLQALDRLETVFTKSDNILVLVHD